MVRTKQNQALEGFDVISGTEMDQCGDSGWVIVKKQRVTILLPPLPIVEVAHEPRPKPADGSLRNTVAGVRHCPDELSPVGRIRSGRFVVTSSLDLSACQQPLSQQPARLDSDKFQKMSKSSNCHNQMRRFSCPYSSLDGCTMKKQRLRARNLERKLKTAGGLSRWLVSLGLERFVRIFERRRVSQFHLASLTMNKLKDMGAIAVGPRRKLMHAIDCCCEP